MNKMKRLCDCVDCYETSIEILEDTIKDLKVKMMKLHRESKRKVEQVCYFWRNKIFEGNTRGGQLLTDYTRDEP